MRCLLLLIFFLYGISTFSNSIRDVPPTILLTTVKFSDYLTHPLKVLIGIQSVRVFGNELAESRLCVIILCDGMILAENEKFRLLTRTLLSLGTEFYIQPYAPKTSILELILRSSLMLSTNGSSVFYFHPQTLFLSNPLMSLTPALTCTAGDIALKDDHFKLIFELGLSFSLYSRIVEDLNPFPILCSYNLLLIPTDVLLPLWKTISTMTSVASVKHENYTNDMDDVLLNIAIAELQLSSIGFFPPESYSAYASKPAITSTIQLGQGSADIYFSFDVVDGSCQVVPEGLVFQPIISMLSERLVKDPLACVILTDRFFRPWVDVIEIGKVDFYLLSSVWNSGYSVCAPPCIFDSSTRVMGKRLNKRLSQNKVDHGMQIVTIGDPAFPGRNLHLAESLSQVVYRTSLYSIGTGIGNADKSKTANLQEALQAALEILKTFLYLPDTSTLPCLFNVEGSDRDDNVHDVYFNHGKNQHLF